ncbi:MAG TPA: hypothetical protein VGT98_16700, partial [Candidatus Elarobacter sp.]|nr:hypothetical protein [Candidatus Elarobacter sp.]
MTFAACASTQAPVANPNDPLSNYDPDRATVAGGGAEFASIYGSMGLVAPGPPISFVGRVAYFATTTRDTTLAVVALSIPNHGLTFKHDSAGYLATYVASLSLEGADLTRAVQARDSETVRIPTFKETSRTDESIIFRRALRVAPGTYDLSLLVRDVNATRESAQRVTITVPRMTGSQVSSLEPVYEAVPRERLDSAPKLLPAPRASYVFGVDDSAAMYVESYDPRTPVSLELRGPTGQVVWRGSAALTPHGTSLASGIAHLPLAHADIGVLTALATHAGAADTSRTSLFLGFGPDLPVLSFNEMLSYLRFFASPNELQALRSASPATRGDR